MVWEKLKKLRSPKILRLTNFKISLVLSLLFAWVILNVTGHDAQEEAGQIFRGFEYKVFDQYFKWRGKRTPPAQVVIAAIDEKSVIKIGRWPWPRIVIADLIRQLHQMGAKAIALDMVFSEKDNLGVHSKVSELVQRLDAIPKLDPNLDAVKTALIAIDGQWQLLSTSAELNASQKKKIEALNELQGKAVDTLFEELKKQKDRESALKEFENFLRLEQERVDADRKLATAVRDSGNVVLGFFFLNRLEIEGLKKEEYWNFSNLEGSTLGVALGGNDLELAKRNLQKLQMFPFTHGVNTNIREIAGENSTQGFFNTQGDFDGIFRRAPLVIAIDGQLYPSLNLQAVQMFYREMEGEDILVPKFYEKDDERGLHEIQPNRQEPIKVDYAGRILYNWYGSSGAIPTYSIIDILEGKIPPEKIKGNIVFIGPTALGIADLRSVPVSEQMPGVEMHATIVGNILEDNYITRPVWILALEVFLMFGVGIAFGFAVGKMRPIWGFLLLVLFLSTLWLAGYLIFFLKFNLWFRPLVPSFGFVSLYMVITLRRFIAEELARRQIKKTFDVYVSPSVVDQMLESSEKFKLGGERKELTVFFSDIRGFTSLSENFEPEDLINFLNEYLTPMTDIVLSYDGTLDKYIGDAIMGFWGAPLPQVDHAQKSCHCALDMISKLKNLREEWLKRNLPVVDIGIGINTGQMAVGNMGSKSRFSYTVMGDEVNLSSRLEGLCKEYGCDIIIGSKTARKVRRDFVLRPLDRVRVKGKAVGEEIFELMGRRNSVHLEEKEKESLLIEISDQFSEALNSFWKREWHQAENIFQKVLELRNEDRPSKIFLEQIHNFQMQEPAAHWDGIRVMSTK